MSNKTKVLGQRIDDAAAPSYSRVSKKKMNPLQSVGSFGKRVVRGVEKVGSLLGSMAKAEVRNFTGNDAFTRSK